MVNARILIPNSINGFRPNYGYLSSSYHEIYVSKRTCSRNDRKVWVFCGDGEMDGQSQKVLSLAGRESLENLIFVINCNLQRLDGPVREMEKLFKN